MPIEEGEDTPYLNYHAAQMTSPKKNYVHIRTKKIPGVGILQKVGVLPVSQKGPRGGRTEIQSYWFDKTKFTVAQAKKWLKDHDIKPRKFEKAKETKKTEAISTEKFRELVEARLPK